MGAVLKNDVYKVKVSSHRIYRISNTDDNIRVNEEAMRRAMNGVKRQMKIDLIYVEHYIKAES